METNDNDKSMLSEVGKLLDRKAVATLAFMDRAVTVSTWALALSITFRGAMAGGASHGWLLRGCWLGLGLTVVCGTGMHLGARSAASRAIAALRENHLSAAAHPFYAGLEFLALAGFGIGFGCLVAFGIVNVEAKQNRAGGEVMRPAAAAPGGKP
jgi:hypothetical protein